MGCCFSAEIPNVEERLNTIEVKENPTSDEEKEPKPQTQPQKQGDIVPLLEGPEPLNFADLNFSSDSDSIDVDMQRIEQLLKESADIENDSQEKEMFEENHSEGLE